MDRQERIQTKQDYSIKKLSKKDETEMQTSTLNTFRMFKFTAELVQTEVCFGLSLIFHFVYLLFTTLEIRMMGRNVVNVNIIVNYKLK